MMQDSFVDQAMSSMIGTDIGIVQNLLKDAERAIGSDIPTARACLSRLLALLDNKEDAIELPSGTIAPMSQAAPVAGGLATWQKRRIESFLEDHIDTPFSVTMLAGLVRLTPSHFCKVFKRSFGIGPSAHIMRRRIERAQAAILSTNEPMSQIALAHGFADQAHFSRVFRQMVGESPSRWRRLHQAEI